MAKINYRWIKNELIASMLIPVLFSIICGIGLSQWFSENAYPVNYDFIDSYDWAYIFRNLYFRMSGACLLYHVGITLLAAKTGWHGQTAWLVYGIISMVISLIVPIYISFVFPEESLCTLWMFLSFILEYLVTYIVSTKLCPRDWNFFPTK